MNAAFITAGLWPEITGAARASSADCSAAVAYFGKGAARLLPLPEGSRLVVDASEGAVKSGQTCPADLLAMVRRGVRVFSVPNLHAKVFVLGSVAFIGSANVSRRSAGTLIEAALRTREPSTVEAARRFVRDHCLHELTPEMLKRLAKIYRPPRLDGGKRRSSRKPAVTGPQPALPRLLLAQLVLGDWDEHDQVLHDAGEVVARKRRGHPRSYEMDSFRWAGRCPFQAGDVVIQITDEGSAGRFMTAPGNVLYVRTHKDKRQRVSFIYLERPSGRRRQAAAIARRLGRGAAERLRRRGQVRDVAFAQALLAIWSK